MPVIVITPPAEEPVSLDQAARQLRISSSADDMLLESRRAPARAWAEHETGRQFMDAVLELRMDSWPSGRVIELPRPPLKAVSSVKYLDADGVEQTMPADAYHVDASGMKGRVVLASGHAWPTLADQPGAVRIRFSAGYGGAKDVPQEAVAAMLLHIQAAHLGEADTHGGYMEAARRCLDPLRVMEVA